MKGLNSHFALCLPGCLGSGAHSITRQWNITRPERGGKGFYPLSVKGSTERGGDTPRGRRPRGVSPTREVDPDMRGGKTFATEREGGVMSLFYDLSPRAIFWV